MTATGAAVYQPAEHAAPLQSTLVTGGVESSVAVSVVWAVFAGAQASLAVTSYVKVPVEPAAKVKVEETYGPPAGAETVSAPCV